MRVIFFNSRFSRFYITEIILFVINFSDFFVRRGGIVNVRVCLKFGMLMAYTVIYEGI